ncbi:MAG: single-stranded DNA-binding protein [Eubacteriales bacterium]|nr:single-stranded DNA-binding protein [Eubacteriales bacterium]
MANFNKVILVGRLTADPELKQTPNGVSVCSFTIAVNRRFARAEQGQQTADFINIVAWRQLADFTANHFKKGRPMLVCGQLQTRSWTDNNGQKRYATEVVADEIEFVDSKNDAQPSSGSSYTPDAYGAPSFNNTSSNTFEAVEDDEGLPF